MDESQADFVADSSFWGRHRFPFFIILSILVSAIIVLVSMGLYRSSGAAQLDLSRPGYVSVRSQATNSVGEFQNYPNSGAISQSAINEFKALYDKQAQKVKTVDAFSGDPLSPDALGISAIVTTEQ